MKEKGKVELSNVTVSDEIECPFVQITNKRDYIGNDTIKFKHGKTKKDVVEWLKWQGFQIRDVEEFCGNMTITMKILS